MYKFNKIEEAIEDIRQGRMVIVVDDPDRENEGDLVMAAELLRGEDINFMAKYARGLICTPMRGEDLDRLEIEPMVRENTDNYETAFTVSIDHVDTSTGISAHERAYSIKKLLDPETRPEDYRRPGHIFPLRAKDKGVLERIGHTEASIDLVELAGLRGPAVICEIMKDDGHMARFPDLMEFREEHGIKIITIADLIRYRKRTEILVDRVASLDLPTNYGNFKLHAYQDQISGKEHLALTLGDLSQGGPVLTRVHSECLTGDALGSQRCDCGEQYDTAMRRIQEEGRGILIYMRQEGRGIGLINKLKAYELQEEGYDTVDANLELGFPADLRDYSSSVHILKDLGVEQVRLMTNNPAKIEGLEKYGVEVVERLPIVMEARESNSFYLKTKKNKMKHIMEVL